MMNPTLRQEHKFCADLYRLLYGFMIEDGSHPVYFCLDPAAANKGTMAGMPDFYFTFVSGNIPFLMEAKIVQKGKIKFCGDSEPRHWCGNGIGRFVPVLWVGCETDFSKFYYWEHDKIAISLKKLVGKGKTARGKNRTLSESVPCDAYSHQYHNVAALAAAIIVWAHKKGFYA